jgi:hypothetical protein
LQRVVPGGGAEVVAVESAATIPGHGDGTTEAEWPKPSLPGAGQKSETLRNRADERFGYSLEELARRCDRSVSWVSRRLGLVELLPDAIQQQVREGKIAAQVAMKFLVPVARQSLEDCQRMAAISLNITATQAKRGNCMLARGIGSDSQTHSERSGAVFQNAAASPS